MGTLARPHRPRISKHTLDATTFSASLLDAPMGWSREDIDGREETGKLVRPQTREVALAPLPDIDDATRRQFLIDSLEVAIIVLGLGVAWPGGVLSVVGLVLMAGAAIAAGTAILRSGGKGREVR